MSSFESFVDDTESPTRARLVECFREDAIPVAHLEGLRDDRFMPVFASLRIGVCGDPPRTTKERRPAHGLRPPVFEGDFRHLRYFIGFRGRRSSLPPAETMGTAGMWSGVPGRGSIGDQARFRGHEAVRASPEVPGNPQRLHPALPCRGGSLIFVGGTSAGSRRGTADLLERER